jgi:hypothetical protein
MGSLASQKQIDYILLLQGKLGMSTRIVERKRRINDRGLTVADASLIIDSLLARLHPTAAADNDYDV